MLPISELDTHSLSSPPLHLSISLVSVSSAGACYSSQLETDASTPIRPQRMVTSLVHTVLRRQGKGSHGLRAAPRRPARHIHTFCVCVCMCTHSLLHSCLITGSPKHRNPRLKCLEKLDRLERSQDMYHSGENTAQTQSKM